MAFGFRVTVLPDACPLLRRDRRSRLPLADRVITVTAVVGPIGRDLANLALDLIEQVGQQLRIFEIISRDDDRHELPRRLVRAEVEFTPRAAARVPVLAHLPLALAIDFDAGRVDDQVQRLALAAARQLDLQSSAAAQRRVIGHAQLHAEQTNDRARQAFGGAQRQAVDFRQSRHAQNRRVSVVGGLAALARAAVVMPRRKQIFADPDGQTSTLDKSFVILTPVTETVRALGLLLCHTSKIPALPSP